MKKDFLAFRRNVALLLFVAWFPVVGRAALPEGYVRLQYIQSTGEQYLDTGFAPTSTSVGYELDFIYNGKVGTEGKRIMGTATRDPDGDGLFLGAYQSLSDEYGGQMFFCGMVDNPMIKTGLRMTLRLVNKVYATSVGVRIDFSSASRTGFLGNVYLGSANFPSQSATLYAPCVFYGLKFYDGETVIHEFVPAKAPDGGVGLYDIAAADSLGFRKSETATPFVAGPELTANGGCVRIQIPILGVNLSVDSVEVDADSYVNDEHGVFVNKGGQVDVEPVVPQGKTLVWRSPLPSGAEVDGAKLRFTVDEDDILVVADLSRGVAAELPSDYARLDHLEATGTQFIDSGVGAVEDVAIEAELACTCETPTIPNYSGAAYSDNRGWICIGDYAGDGTLVSFFSTSEKRGARIGYDTDYHHYVSAQKYQSIDETVAFSRAVAMGTGLTIRVLDSDLGWASDHVRQQSVKYFVIYKNGAVVRNFIPAVRLADGEAGLYDAQNGVFYSNAGSGSFRFDGDDALRVVGAPVLFGTPTPGYGYDMAAVVGEERTYSAPVGCYPATNATGDVVYTGCAGCELRLSNGTVITNAETSVTLTYSDELRFGRLTWLFDASYLLTADADGSLGEVSGAGFHAVGEVVRLSAQPKKGSFFVRWQGECVPADAATNPNLVFAMPNHSVRVTALFRSPYRPDSEDVSTSGLVMSFLGDSYSAFSDFAVSNYTAEIPYYPALDVTSVDQMWWRIAIDELGGTLGVSHARGGSSIGYKKDKSASFIAREWRGASDILFIFGGANDQSAGAAQGEYLYDPLKWTNTTLMDFRPACAALLSRLKGINPKTRIYFIANAPATSDTDVYLKPEYIESIRKVCAHYGVPCIELADIERSDRHPTAAGMASIARQVVDFVRNDFTNRAQVAYADDYVTSNDASLRCLRRNGERVYVSTNASKNVTIVAKRSMTLTRLLAVGGGGCGGQAVGGGGGGGGVVDQVMDLPIPGGEKISLTVGAGGGVPMPTGREKSSDRVSPDDNFWQYGISGTPSSVRLGDRVLVTAGGGGGGGGWSTSPGNVRSAGRSATLGGNGGGGSRAASGGSASAGGFAGGASDGTASGGGGGASCEGTAGVGSACGAGGAGVFSDITGVSLEYGAGGGGGAGYSATAAGAAGGASAGAGGAIGLCGLDGVDGRGGGGGGGSYDAEDYGYVGGKGGDGTVILRFACKSGMIIMVR